MKFRTIALVSAQLAGVATFACCGVGEDPASIDFGSQQNIIIWDAATKTEHFIRRANFRSGNKEFGFIAPTPTVPELGEVKDAAFTIAAAATAAYEKAKRDAELFPQMGCAAAAKSVEAAAGEAKSVEILQEMDLAGYRATTIRAKDAKAFRAWLADHNFKTEKSIEEWISFYVKKDWVFTAFIVKPIDDVAKTSPVRMSFKTERPYAPFYVPSVNQGSDDGTLAVAFYAAGAYKTDDPNAYASATIPVRGDFVKQLAETTGVKQIPTGLGLTSFSLDGWPVADSKDDLFFSQSGDVPRWPVNLNPAKPYLGAAILGLVAYRVVRRAKAKV